MAQTIKLKRSSVAGNIPSTSDLALGEVAINTADGKMYIKKSVDGTDSIIDLSDSPQDAILQEYQFTASANQTTFSGADDNNDTLYYTAGAVQIFLNGILLDSGVDYTATSNTSIVLAETVDANDYLQVFAFKQKISGGSVTVNTFTGNGSTTAFTLSVNPGDENNTRVFIDGVYQSKSNYSVSATTLTFTTAPPTGTAIEVESGNRDVALDTATNLDFPDDVKLRLGTSQDLEIYHDGSNSYIDEGGTGKLILESNSAIKLQTSGGGETLASFNNQGAVELFYDNGKKFETDAQGINVTGGIDVADITATGNISLNSDGGTAYFGAGADLRIYHSSGNSYIKNITSQLYVLADYFNVKNAANSKFAIRTFPSDAVKLYFNNGEKLATTSSGINVTGNATFSGTISSGAITSSGNISGSNLNVTSTNWLGWGDYGERIIGANSASSLYFYTDATLALTLDGSQNATFAGTISSGAITSTGLNSTSGTVQFTDGGVAFDSSDASGYPRFSVTNGSAQLGLFRAGSSAGGSYIGADENKLLRVYNSSFASKFDIDTSGNVTALGSVTSTGLTVDGGSNGMIDFGDVTSAYGRLYADSTGTFIGSKSNHPLILRTNNTERMRIDSAGDLTLKGGRIILRESDDGNDAVKLTRDADEGYLQLFSSGSQTVEVRGNGNSYFNGGNVGIGTTTPDQPLHVVGIRPLRLERSGVGEFEISIDNTVSGDSSDFVIEPVSGTNSAGFQVRTRNTAGSLIEALNVNHDGNVGIGTDSPTTDVTKFGSGATGLSVAGGQPTVAVRATSNAQYVGYFGQVATNTYLGALGGGDLLIQTGTGGTEKMRITAGGRVGIGQTPLANNFALQVTGLGGGSNDARAVYLKGHGNHTTIGGTGPTLTLQNTNSTANNIVKLSFESASSGETVSINAINTNHTSHYGDMAFNTRGSAGYSEKLRITSNGEIRVQNQTLVDSANTNHIMIFPNNKGISIGTAYTYGEFNANNGNVYIRANSYPANTGSESIIYLQTANSSGGQSSDVVVKGGNVGIGTSSPNAFLSVRKDNSNSGNQFVVADTEGASPGVRTYTYNGDDSGLILNHYYAVGGSGNEYMRYADFVANVGNGAGTTMRFITKNAANTFSVGLTQDNNGNVGIGTTNPLGKLHIRDGSAQAGISHTYIYDGSSISVEATEPSIQLMAEDSGTHGGSLLWRYGNNTFAAIANPTTDAIDFTYGVSTANDFQVHSGTNMSSYLKIMSIGGDGNVGIGQPSPTHKLHVKKDNDYAAKFGGTGGGDYSIEIGQGTTNSSAGFNATGSGGSMLFKVQDAEYMRIKPDGNVGIGTTAPTQKLEVAGTALVENAKLKAIAESNTDTAVDVFVYDTSKDSDGGAWRKRTQNTSWYNETLNTSIRGARKEFPCVAVIVSESDKVTIYDGDDPSMPMWMVFSNTNLIYAATRTSLAMLNGLMFTSGSTSVTEINFITEFMGLHQDSAVSQMKPAWKTGIIGRYSGAGSWITEGGGTGSVINDNHQLVNRNTNDIAMTVLPNAPIDADTGLPVPTIAVATNGGVSVIKDDGSVVDITNSGDTGYQVVGVVDFIGTSEIIFGMDASTGARAIRVHDIPLADVSVGANWYLKGTSKRFYKGYAISTAPDLYILGENSTVKKFMLDGVISSNLGLTLLDENITTPTEGSAAYITSNYNTGWMHGDIKLATLSDTDDTNVTYANLITNGAFASNITGWSNFTGSVAHDTTAGGRIAVTSNGSYYGGVQTLTAVAGKTYALTFTAVSGTTGARIRAGNASSGTNYLNAAVADGTHTYFFTTDTTTTVRIFLSTSGASGTCYFDNITLSLAERDHTVNSAGDSNTKELKVFGTITKTAVATGAELVGYSGFSTSNYLEQPYNSDLDFGTGDFSITLWIKGGSNGRVVFDRLGADQRGLQGSSTDTTKRIYIYTSSDRYEFIAGGGQITASEAQIDISSEWKLLTCLRKSGVMSMYENGVHKFSKANTNTIGHTDHITRVGTGVVWNNSPHPGSLALVRVSATAPTAEQIAKMYRDEKPLFQENAKATLYGTSNAVTALAYDDDTELLHVGTSAGRSEFQGLNRVNNTTDAVSAAISASNGFIVEE